MPVDLHVHTRASDGSLSPQQVVELALEYGLDAISITDHDCVEAIAPAIRYAKNKKIEVVPGVEIGGALNGCDTHILGYFIDYQDPKLLEFLETLKANRFARAQLIIEMMNNDGIEIDLQDVLNEAGSGTIGRLHIAKVLVNKGVVQNVQSAFENKIGKGSPYYAPKATIDSIRIIRVILEASGFPVLAHPKLLRDQNVINTLVAAGLKGIEVYHYENAASDEMHYRKLAKKLNVAISGGSDFHGLTTKKNHADTLRQLPNELLEEIRVAWNDLHIKQ